MDSPKRFLVIRCGALGDLVYATSIIDALIYEYGEDVTIDFVSTPGSGSLFGVDKRINHVYSLKHKKIPIWLSSQKKEIIKASQNNPYDLLINFEYGKQFKSLIYAVHAKKKIGPHFENMIIPKKLTHMVDITKYFFREIVSKEVFEKSFPRLVGNDIEEVKKKYNLSQQYFIVSPSNSHQKRNIINYRAWENESWKELIEKLQKNVQVVVIGNKGEDEFFHKLKPYPEGVVDLVGKTPLSDLIGVIDGACGLVATDTGTAHMASAVNTEVFALIGPTPADVTGPYQSPFNKVHIISKKLDCSPCYKTKVMKDCKDNICMKQISVDMVFDTINSAIKWNTDEK
jgi:ADP-heptose:LPS heptosyltransferase